jgi:hypothetical protein
MSEVDPLYQHVAACAHRVCGGQGAMKWTQSRPGPHLATAKQFRDFSGFREGAKGSFQQANKSKNGDTTISCVKDIFNNHDWIKWVTGFHRVPG